jgi:hypothetical protein
MDPKILKSIVSQVHRRFPEFADSQPKVRLQASPQAKSIPAQPTYLITFRGTAQAASSTGTKTITRWVRVVAYENGKIIKITTSR